MKNIAQIFCILTLVSSCAKNKWNDVSGSATINGVVVIVDTLSGITKYINGKELDVYLKNAHSGSSFLYSVKSNAQGAYSFSGISIDSSYIIYASVTAESIKYNGQISYNSGTYVDRQSDTLKLFPSLQYQNGIHLIIRDTTGAFSGNVTTWVYSSPIAFYGGTQEGKIFDMNSNGNGVSNVFNLNAGKYFLRAITKIAGVDVKGEDSVVVSQQGIETKTLILKPYVIHKNGFDLTIFDIDTFPVSDAIVYTYTSRSVFAADSSFASSMYIDTSNATGHATRFNIPALQYFFRVRRKVGNTEFSTVDSLLVGNSGIGALTIYLK